jgi:hypothetical protein
MKSKRRPVIELALDVDQLTEAIVAKLRPLIRELVGKTKSSDADAGERSWWLSEWAKLRGVSKSYAQREVYAGRLKAKRMPGRGARGTWLVTPEADREWLASLPASQIKQSNGVDEEQIAP